MVYKYLGSMGIYVGHTQHDTDTATQQTLKSSIRETTARLCVYACICVNVH